MDWVIKAQSTFILSGVFIMKPKLKVGLTCNGGMIRGIFKEEMSHANSAVLDSVIYKMLDRLYDVTFYLLKPAAMRTTEKLLMKKQAEGDEFALRFDLTYKKDVSEYPKHLDLIFAGQGSDVLLMTGNFQGGKFTHAFSYFYTLAMYPEVPVFAIQTDFVTYFPVTESYGHGIFTGMFPDLFANRGMFIIPMGTTPQDKHIYFERKAANSLPTHNFMFTSVDQQFMIEPDWSDAREVPEQVKGVAFAGKDRTQGNRLGSFLAMSRSAPNVPFFLIGKWDSQGAVNNIKNFSGGNVTTTPKAVDHHEVLDYYNEYGFTAYLSCVEYRNCATITSRFTDSLKAGAIPLIWKDEAATFKKYFDPSVIDRITVDENNGADVIASLQDYSERVEIIKYLKSRYEELHKLVIPEIEDYLVKVVESADDLFTPMTSAELAKHIKHHFMTRKSRPFKEEDANNIACSNVQFIGKSFDEIKHALPYSTKIHMGLYGVARDRETWDDMPEAVDKEVTRLMEFLQARN